MIQALQEPSDLDVDDSNRVQVGFNVMAWKQPSGTFLQELIAILVEAGVGVENETIFATSKAPIPTLSATDEDQAFLVVKATGGTSPLGTHNHGPTAIRRPSAQIIARAKSWQAAEAMAQAAYNALTSIRNEAVSA